VVAGSSATAIRVLALDVSANLWLEGAYLAGDATEKGVLKAIDRGFTEAWNFFL
jgi:hypothetical protein